MKSQSMQGARQCPECRAPKLYGSATYVKYTCGSAYDKPVIVGEKGVYYLRCALKTREGKMNEVALLKAVLMEILDDDIDMYPKRFVGKYEHRTQYMEGWNAANMKQCERLIEIFKEYGITCIDDIEVIGPKVALKTAETGDDFSGLDYPYPEQPCGN